MSIEVYIFGAVALAVIGFLLYQNRAKIQAAAQTEAAKVSGDVKSSLNALHDKVNSLTTKVDATHAAALAPVTVALVPAAPPVVAAPPVAAPVTVTISGHPDSVNPILAAFTRTAADAARQDALVADELKTQAKLNATVDPAALFVSENGAYAVVVKGGDTFAFTANAGNFTLQKSNDHGTINANVIQNGAVVGNDLEKSTFALAAGPAQIVGIGTGDASYSLHPA